MQYCCPNPNCKWSDPDIIPRNGHWYTSHGYYPSKQYGRVPRYICRNCRTTFTLRTGGLNWHLRDDGCNVIDMCSKWLKGESVGELAIEYGVSRQMIRTRLKRMRTEKSVQGRRGNQ